MVQGLLEAVGPELASKLGRPVYSNTVVAEVSEYMQERWGRTRAANGPSRNVTYQHAIITITRYGFREDTKVAAFTGDNPSSLAGLAMKPGDIGN